MNTLVILPVFQRYTHLYGVLRKLQTQQTLPSEIIVVDSSLDFQDITPDFPKVHQLRVNSNNYWTGAVNRGLEFVLNTCSVSKEDVVVLLNDDVELEDSWLENLLSDYAQVGPRSLVGCINVDAQDRDTIRYAGRWKNAYFALSRKFLVGKSYRQLEDLEPLVSFDLIGRGCLIPVSVFQELGLYDEQHFIHRGDTELPLRARMHGYTLYVSKKAVVYSYPTLTAGIDTKEYVLSDLKPYFFDFRSSAYWKYRFYYAKIVSRGKVIPWMSFFLCRMFLHLLAFLSKSRYMAIFRK